jgi:hypothetical protein
MLTVLVPWRPQPSRLESFDRVVDWYRSNLGDVNIQAVDSDDEVFNLARCRNLGVRSIADENEVVVINDADTIPERDALLEAVAAASVSGRVHLPYTRYQWLGPEGMAELNAGTELADCSHELVIGACSGVYVTTPATWWSHGGQDERFRGWGFEDAAWNIAHTSLLGEPPRRHDGRVFALYHDQELREGTNYDANAALMQQYRDAAASQEAMSQFVRNERNAERALTLPGS